MIIKEKIIDIISLYSDLENVKQYLHENDDLTKLGVNSISFIKMVVALENEFNFEFEDEALDYNKFKSLNMLHNYVENQMKINNVIYTPSDESKYYENIKKEIVAILFQNSNNLIINNPAFNDLLDLNISSNQFEKILSDIQEKFKININVELVKLEKLFLLDNLCKYILNNRHVCEPKKTAI